MWGRPSFRARTERDGLLCRPHILALMSLNCTPASKGTMVDNLDVTDGQADDDLLELGSKTLDEIFAIYSAKLNQLRMLEQSLATTERAGTVFAEIFSKIIPANDNTPPPRVTLHAIEAEIISRLAREPEDLYQMQPRYFEELVCALLVDMGLDVHLTPQTRDGGRDILA